MEIGEAKLIFYSDAELLEGPRWNKNTEELLFVSIMEGIVYLYDLKTKNIKSFVMPGQVGCANFLSDNCIVVACYTGIYYVNTQTGDMSLKTHLIKSEDLRYNDGVLDSSKRLLVGTTGYNCYAEKRNSLYMWDGDTYKELISKTSISNGIAFSKDDKFMFFVDTPTKKVSRYMYNIENGEIRYDKDIIEILDDSLPDGIEMDSQDNLWVAHWGGGKVTKWDSKSGELLDTIVLPCKNVSACCIIGSSEEFLCVTTAKHDDGTQSEDMAGGLYLLRIK